MRVRCRRWTWTAAWPCQSRGGLACVLVYARRRTRHQQGDHPKTIPAINLLLDRTSGAAPQLSLGVGARWPVPSQAGRAVPRAAPVRDPQRRRRAPGAPRRTFAAV